MLHEFNIYANDNGYGGESESHIRAAAAAVTTTGQAAKARARVEQRLQQRTESDQEIIDDRTSKNDQEMQCRRERVIQLHEYSRKGVRDDGAG